jgi:glyoxylase-like metal-dependent hydrolase (beta-lactamase superfamily II)
VDTGLGTETTKDVWKATFDGPMGGHPVTHVIATHLHPDHVGCAGWLVREFHVDLWMSREEYMLCRILVGDTGRQAPPEGVQFYESAGFPSDAIDRYRKNFGMFGKMVAPMPESYKRLEDGQHHRFGDHEWEVMVGRGHSPEHACLYCADCNVLLSGDQVLPSISSNVSVWPTEPEANPLHDWISTLRGLKARLPEDVLVLPAHGKPFRGAHNRIDDLVNEHLDKLDQLLEFCKEPRRAIDAFPALFRSQVPDDHLIMATGEAIAHLNYLHNEGALIADTDGDGIIWYHRN